MKYPTSSTMQEIGDEFYTMIGHCIAGWAEVDDSLFNVFQFCVGQREQCAIIYFRIQSLSTRFDLVDELVKSVLPKKLRESGGHDDPSVKAWNKAREGVSNLLQVRSRIAHHPVGMKIQTVNLKPHRGDGENPEIVSVSAGMRTWFEISVNEAETLRGRSSRLPDLNIDNLKSHVADITHLRDRLRKFYYDVLTKQFIRPPLGIPPSSHRTDPKQGLSKARVRRGRTS